MRIAFTHAYCWPDVRRGGERYLHELSRAVASAGHDVTVFSTSASAAGRGAESGVIMRRFRPAPGAPHVVERVFGLQVLPRLLRGFDVTHSLLPTDAAASIVAGRLGRVGRSVYTNLGIPDRALWADRHDRRPHAFVTEHVDDYGCLSLAAGRALADTFGRLPVLTPGGVDLRRFGPVAPKATDPTLLYCGTFEDPMKNLPLLLTAFERLLERRPRTRLQLSGPGDPGPLLRHLTGRTLDQVTVLPLATPDLAEVYSRAWATVIPSKWESFALALVESLACGTPIVAADHSASRERVAPGAGVLCRPDDLESLVDACDEVLDLATRPGITDHCRDVATPYDWPSLVPTYERIYSGAEPPVARKELG